MTSHCMTPPELARRWATKPESIRTLIASGRLRAFNIAGPKSKRPRWRIAMAEVERFERGDPLPMPEPAAPRPRPRTRAVPTFAGPF